MPISPHVRALRAAVGTRLLLLPGVAAVVRDAHGAVLVHRRSDDGRWSLPAGAVEPGESPAQAVVREVREETGLVTVPERVLGVFGGEGFRHTYPNGDEVEYTVVVFACRVVGGELAALDGEALELRWFPPEAMPPLGLRYPPELFLHDAPRRTLF
ncbi:MAG TPA: NUDIX domain-containing protein [Longimicrobiaceae bacterium]|nr:NUDIX domain-containing protein [Longimicrobiaceae bacterium]